MMGASQWWSTVQDDQIEVDTIAHFFIIEDTEYLEWVLVVFFLLINMVKTDEQLKFIFSII